MNPIEKLIHQVHREYILKFGDGPRMLEMHPETFTKLMDSAGAHAMMISMSPAFNGSCHHYLGMPIHFDPNQTKLCLKGEVFSWKRPEDGRGIA